MKELHSVETWRTRSKWWWVQALRSTSKESETQVCERTPNMYFSMGEILGLLRCRDLVEVWWTTKSRKLACHNKNSQQDVTLASESMHLCVSKASRLWQWENISGWVYSRDGRYKAEGRGRQNSQLRFQTSVTLMWWPQEVILVLG